MIKFLPFLGFALLSGWMGQDSLASDLNECQAKITSLITQVPKTEVKGPSGSLEFYHLSEDLGCGVEWIAEKGYFTATLFRADGALKKFETILLNENDTTFGGRVKGKVTCEVNGNSVVYKTKFPILSDGVRSPFQVKTLRVALEGNQISVKAVAGIYFIKSTVACQLQL